MKFEKLREILLDMGIFKIKGSMSPPNNRVIFECIPLRIIVTPNECEVMYDHLFYWTFSLKRITTKELFVMLDEFFPQEDEDYDMNWSSMPWSSMVEPDLGFGDTDKWKAFKSKWTREEKLEELI
jgi:hypothetical protein